MDRNESTNEGGSSPDTVIARSSSEEEKKQKPIAGSTSGEYITVGDSSSSLDTLTSGSGGVAIPSVGTDEKKKGKFGAFKSSLRESGLFKIKKKLRESDVSVGAEQDDKAARKQTEGDKG